MRQRRGKEARVSSLVAKIRSKTGTLYRVFCSKISHMSRTLSPSRLIRSEVQFCWDSSVGENLPFLLNPVWFFSTDPTREKRNPAWWWLGCRAIGVGDYGRCRDGGHRQPMGGATTAEFEIEHGSWAALGSGPRRGRLGRCWANGWVACKVGQGRPGWADWLDFSPIG
jgi:hypothetical protein